MELTDFIEKFIEVVEVDNKASVKPETKFRDLDEWSSLSGLSIIALADEEYGIILEPSVIKNASTIEDLFNSILSLK